MQKTIRLGQCWVVRLTKSETAVRVEDFCPQGGWIARSLSHGRNVRVRKADQFLHRCDVDGLHLVADETKPNRRSTALPSVACREQSEHAETPQIDDAEQESTRLAIFRRVPEPVHAMTLLDATAIILKEKRRDMSTKEIILAIQEKKLWTTSGSTPWLTLATALKRDMERHGSASRFKRAAERGKFMLR